MELNNQINGADVTLDGGLLTIAAGVLDTAGPLLVNNNATVEALGINTQFQFGGTVFSSAGLNYLKGNFLLGGKTRDFNVTGNGTVLTMTGTVDDGAGLDASNNVVTTGGIRKTGPSHFRLSSTGTFKGPVIASAGDLQIYNPASFGDAGGNVTIEDGASLSLPGINVTGETLFLGGELYIPTGVNTWTGNIVLQSTADPIRMNPPPENCYLKHTGIMSGPGGLVLDGGGTLELAGAAGNTFTGETVVNRGTMRLNKSSGNAIPGPLTINSISYLVQTTVVLAGDHQIADNATILMEGSGSILDLAGQDETIGALTTFGFEGGEVKMGDSPARTATFTTGNNNLNTSYNGRITGAAGMTVVKTGSGTFKMKASFSTALNTYTGQTRVVGGTLDVDEYQQVGKVVVKPGAILKGHGVTGQVILDGGSLAATHLDTGDLSTNPSGGTYLVDLFGPAPTMGGYDQLRVAGTVNLFSSTLIAGLGFTPVTGAKFMIIKNNGTDAVTGQFASLPEGHGLNIGGKPFSIPYKGGDGNDVELTYLGLGGPPRILTIQYEKALDRIYLQAVAPPTARCYWQFSSGMGNWTTFAPGNPDTAGLLDVTQVLGLHASRMFFRLQAVP